MVPNLADYDAVCRAFSWDGARRALSGLPGGGLNIAHEAVDRHAAGPRAGHEALRFVRADGSTHSLSYRELAEQTSRFAAVLAQLGIGRTERVFSLMGRSPELYLAVLGTLKNGSVFCPLFSAFGPDPVRQRLQLGSGRVLVTTRALYRKKVARIRDALPDLTHVLLIDADGEPEPGTLDLAMLMEAAPGDAGIASTQGEDMALLHFTSGTTGTPKGAIHVHEAVTAHYATGLYALDLHPDDVYWCTADPGWVTGTSYGVIAPLVHGVTTVVDQEEMDADRWYRILAEQRVTVWYTAPTALRMLMKAGADRASGHDLSALRFVASVGEPLNPEVVVWGREAFGQPVHDNWWQTETGGIMIANFAATEIRPGSMGRPLPGVEAALVQRDENGKPVIADGLPVLVTEPDAMGELALRAGWPSMFRGYLHEEERYRRCFSSEGGTSPGTSPSVMRTDTTGSWAAVTMSLNPPATSSAPSRWKVRSWSTRLWPRPGSLASPIPLQGKWSRRSWSCGTGGSPQRSFAWTSSASPANGSAPRWPRGWSSSPRRSRGRAAGRSCAGS